MTSRQGQDRTQFHTLWLCSTISPSLREALPQYLHWKKGARLVLWMRAAGEMTKCVWPHSADSASEHRHAAWVIMGVNLGSEPLSMEGTPKTRGAPLGAPHCRQTQHSLFQVVSSADPPTAHPVTLSGTQQTLLALYTPAGARVLAPIAPGLP